MTPAKRTLDVVASAAGLLLLSPLLAVVALAVRADGGPALFRQARVGRGGREFRMLKFRSMITDAERRGPQLTTGADPRITRVGRLLRATKLDELPQLWNVLVGEMSLVGPRPEVPRYVAMYSATQREVLWLTPGITDVASLRYRDEAALLAASVDPERTYVERVMPDKIALNLAYAARATVWRDLGVVLATVGLLPRPGKATLDQPATGAAAR